jgi:hypothetical protein
VTNYLTHIVEISLFKEIADVNCCKYARISII